MYKQKRYSKAPITEAIIDFRVALPEGFSADNFANIHSHISDRFPTKQPIYAGMGSLVFQPGSSVKVDANQQEMGFLFRSRDNLRILQATLNGFTFNRLAPYDSWEEFSSDAKYLWNI